MNLEELLSALESPIVIRPTRRMTQGELESDRLDLEFIRITLAGPRRLAH